MAEFDEKSVARFWHAYEDPSIYRVVTFMEGVEDWVLDGDPALEAALTELAKELDDLNNVRLHEQKDIVKLANFLKSSRALRLLHIIDTVQPGTASKILIHTEETTKKEDDDAGIFLRRNIVFERLRLLSRVFSPDRIKLVLKALEGDDSE